MGSGQGNIRIKNCQTGLEYIQNLIPNVEIQLSSQIKNKLKQIMLQMPKVSRDIENLYNYFTQDHFDFEKYSSEDFEHLNILSPFQIKLLEPSKINDKQEQNVSDQNFKQLKIKYINLLRLLDIKQLEKFKLNELKEFGFISILIKAIKNYCILTNNLLLKCKQDKELQLIIYVIIWEHFSQKLSKLSEKYSFNKINQAFDEYFFTNLRPHIKVETLGAKIWGGQVDIDKEFAINQILLSRISRKSNLPLSRIATVLLEMSIDVYNLLFAGSDEFVIPKLIQKLQEQSRQLYEINFNGDYVDFFQFCFQDKKYILTIFAEWIVENYVDTILFEFLEDHFCQQILKLTSEEQQQINTTYLKEFQVKPIIFDENEFGKEDDQYLKNLITFDQFLISQQESTISILTKRVANEKINSDVLRSSTTANYSGLLIDHQLVIQQINQQSIEEQQDFSDIQSENRSSHLSSGFMTKQSKVKLLSLEELEHIINQYDIIKFPIASRIEARNQRIKMKNQDIIRINYEFRCLFSFENQKGDLLIQQQQDFCDLFLNKEQKVQSVMNQKECSKSIAEMILEI